MPTFGPISRRELIRSLRQIGSKGQFYRGKHQYIVLGKITIRIPNPHRGDIGVELLRRILLQAGVSRDEWEAT